MDKLKQWVALTVVGCMAVLAAGWFLLISPKKAEAADLVAQTATQEATNDGLRTQLEVLKAQAKDLPKKQAELARVQAKIPDNPALPTLIRALTSAASASGVELVSVTPGAPVAVAAAVTATPPTPVPAAEGAAAAAAPADGAAPAAPAAAGAAGTPTAVAPAGTLAAIPLGINVVGGYFEVAQFLSEIEQLPRALRVTALTVAPGLSPVAGPNAAAGAPADGRSITTTITGSVYLAANRPPVAAVVAPVS